MSTDEFLRGLNLLDERVRKAATKGIAVASMALLQDSIMEVPKVPHDEGTLRGSGSVHVNGKLEATSEDLADGGNPTPFTSGISGDRVRDAVVGRVGFNTPYATRLHEAEEGIVFHETGTGGKLGVIGTAPVVNVIDQRTAEAPQPEIRRWRGTDGTQHIDVFIRESMERSMNRGELDNVIMTNFGLRRRPI